MNDFAQPSGFLQFISKVNGHVVSLCTFSISKVLKTWPISFIAAPQQRCNIVTV